MLVFWRKMYNYTLSTDKKFVRKITNITGMIPQEPEVYRLALRHSSMVIDVKNSAQECNERLEYLGDSVLGTIVAEYLFKKFPYRNEGFLTEMRSRIVSRTMLNEIGYKIGFHKLIEYNYRHGGLNRSAYGNTLEAFIGAVYIDLGYLAASKFVYRRILHPYIDIQGLEEQNLNFKSQLMEFAQKHKIEPIVYEIVEEKKDGIVKEFTVACKVQNEVLGYGTDKKKKNAEQKASEMALNKLNADGVYLSY